MGKVWRGTLRTGSQAVKALLEWVPIAAPLFPFILPSKGLVIALVCVSVNVLNQQIQNNRDDADGELGPKRT